MTARQRYETLKQLREGPLMRARDAAVLTIPGLMPPDGHDGSMPLYKPFQSVGARGVNNLAGKFLMALFPPTSSFFKLELDAKVEDEAEQGGGGDTLVEIKKQLAKVEKRVAKRIEQNGSRAPIYEAFRHLIGCGSVLLQVMDRGRIRYFPMDRYVVKRDGEGTVLDIVVMQKFAKMSLPPKALEVVEKLTKESPEKLTAQTDKSAENIIEVYTRVTRTTENYTIHQEVLDEKIPDTEGTYPLDRCPWIAARFSRIDGEDWGRGLVEEYIGDLTTLESLSQSTVEMAAQLARILWFVDPGSMTTPEDVAKALNGDVLEGRASDISVMRADKVAEFNATLQKEQAAERRMEQAFLLISGVQRDAERVTAEEVRTVAAELEQSFGGTYALFAEEIQLPLSKLVLAQMQKEGSLPQFSSKQVVPQIVTGSAALGRFGDAQKLTQLAAQVSQLFGPEVTSQWIDVGKFITMLAVSIGVDVEEAVRSSEDVQRMAQAKAAQESLNAMAPELIKQGQQQNQPAAPAA